MDADLVNGEERMDAFQTHTKVKETKRQIDEMHQETSEHFCNTFVAYGTYFFVNALARILKAISYFNANCIYSNSQS